MSNEIYLILSAAKTQLETGKELIARARANVASLGQAGQPIDLSVAELEIDKQLSRINDKIRYLNRIKL